MNTDFSNPPWNACLGTNLLNANVPALELAGIERQRDGAGIRDSGVNGRHGRSSGPRQTPLVTVRRHRDHDVARKANRKRAHLEHESTNRLLCPEIDANFLVADLVGASVPGGLDAAVRHAADVLVVTIRRHVLDGESVA